MSLKKTTSSKSAQGVIILGKYSEEHKIIETWAHLNKKFFVQSVSELFEICKVAGEPLEKGNPNTLALLYIFVTRYPAGTYDVELAPKRFRPQVFPGGFGQCIRAIFQRNSTNSATEIADKKVVGVLFCWIYQNGNLFVIC